MRKHRILGMMSGTSLDGLDLALAELTRDQDQWTYRLLATRGLPYEPSLRSRLEASIGWEAADLLAFHAEYGKWLGLQAAKFLEETGLEADAVASHGHTVHHRPGRGFTFQLGCPPAPPSINTSPCVSAMFSINNVISRSIGSLWKLARALNNA